jgi:hypothetical protein
MGLQNGYTKFCCFLCEWHSHAKGVHCSKKKWPLHKSHTPGTRNVAHQSLVHPCKVLLSVLHNKLGLMKNFVKAVYRNGPEFSFLCEKFPRLSTDKIKAGVLIGPRYLSSSETLNLISFSLMTRRQPGMLFDVFRLVL